MMQEESDESEEDRQATEDRVAAQMGCLLLLASRDFKNAADIATLETDDEIYDAFSIGVESILEPIRLRLLENLEEFRSYSIQSPDEALFHRLSLEMADLLLLETGSVNFGIIQDAIQYILPEHFKDLAAVNTLHILLETLEDTPALWKIISQAKAPTTEDSPSNLAVRVALGLPPEEKITDRHAQITVLSSFLGHFRQARAGTCFTTAPLMDILYHQPDMFLSDMADLVENGCVTRVVHGEKRDFPFQFTSSNDFLTVQIITDRLGRVTSTRKYELRTGESPTWEGPYEDSYLYEAPVVLAICQTLGLDDPESAVLESLRFLKNPFSVNELLEQLAKIAFASQEKGVYLRSRTKYTLEELVTRGRYAFCSQTNHPLHRAYEQAIVSSVKYMGSKYGMGIRSYQLFEDHVKGKDKGCSVEFQTRFRSLMREILLPLITRMRYRYNHNIDGDLTLFDDGNHGVHSKRCYGYELCDGGLPENFQYSTKLYTEIQQGSDFIKIETHNESPSAHGWTLVNTPEKFVAFFQDIIRQTTEHLKEKDSAHADLWDDVASKMCNVVSEKSFTERMASRMFSSSKKNHKKNPFTNDTTPWMLKIGGDFDAVLQTFFGFIKSPSKMKEFNGNQREVLAKCISWIRNQPDELREEFADPRSQLLITSPCHAFLLTPNEPTFRAAWESDVAPIDYIEEEIINPGLEVAKSTIPLKSKEKLVEYVTSNLWAHRDRERHDFERQQLTEFSKEKFDALLAEQQDLEHLSPTGFLNAIWQIVVQSRAADPKIDSRNAEWERKCKLALKNKMDKLYVKRGDWKEGLIEFARNRVDTISLSNKAVKRFNKMIESIMDEDVSYTDFRQAILQAAYDCHCQDLCFKDKDWKSFFCEEIDTKLFEFLSKKNQQKLIESGIITHDPNWKLEMYDFRTMWLVNPGSGQLEMCNYIPDLNQVTFRSQKEWFPETLGPRRGWTFPDNYLAWNHGPLFNVKKMMEI